MSGAESNDNTETVKLPAPVMKRTRWPVPIIWLVPVLAAVIAGFYWHDHMQHHGPLVMIQFDDASGLKSGETPVNHLGVKVGQVSSIALTEDGRHVDVQIRLERANQSFALAGAKYWIVRPEISAASIRGLGTITSGPYVEALPGNGKETKKFVGLTTPPPSSEDGLHLVLHSPRLAQVQADSLVYYRGIQVGVVQSVDLSEDSRGVDVTVFLRKRYTSIVRTNSKFWLLKGADIEGGLLSGVQVKVQSLRALIAGGIAFATPDRLGDQASDGANFPLYDDAKKEWQDWSPEIDLPPATEEDAKALKPAKIRHSAQSPAESP